MILTGLVALALLALVIRTLFKPGTEKKVIAFEEQGWFSTTAYKKSQGQRVRRGTILGVLVLGGAGIWTLVSNRSLGGGDWTLRLPFTGTVRVVNLGDTVKANPALPNEFWFGGKVPPPNELSSERTKELLQAPGYLFIADLRSFKETNDYLKDHYAKIEKPGDSDFAPGDVVAKDLVEKARRDLAAENKNPPILDNKGTVLASGPREGPDYKTLTLLPHVRYTVPLLLAALSLWVGWRIVNVPTFTDFLIATEAELNKVSWTTRKRLIQDTIVVLVTVVLLTFFLFVVDGAWSWLLSRKIINVLQIPETKERIGPQEQPW
jgi:preprotein translocase SecE subunit